MLYLSSPRSTQHGCHFRRTNLFTHTQALPVLNLRSLACKSRRLPLSHDNPLFVRIRHCLSYTATVWLLSLTVPHSNSAPLLQCHTLTVPHSYSAPLLLCHTLTVLHSYCATLLLCHTLTVPHSYCATLLQCHTLTVPHSYSVTLLLQCMALTVYVIITV